MPRGRSESQLARSASLSRLIVRLLPLALAAPAIVLLLRSRPALVSFAGVYRHLDSSWLRLFLCGTVGLLAFVLLWFVLQIAERALRFAPVRHQADRPPPASAGDSIEPATLQPTEPAPAQKSATVGPQSDPPPPPLLADLQNASPRDSRFRTRAHFSGQKRRASDYEGPLRRATDRRPQPKYSGPLRRATDKQGSVNQPPNHNSSERRVSDRRSTGLQEVVAHEALLQEIPENQKGQRIQQPQQEARQHRVATPDADSNLLHEPLHAAGARDVLPASITHDAAGQTLRPSQRP